MYKIIIMYYCIIKSSYFNRSATDYLLDQGQYVQLKVDPDTQTIKVVPHQESKKLRYRLYPGLTTNIQNGPLLLRIGMKDGRYIHIGDNLFRHMGHMQSNPE